MSVIFQIARATTRAAIAAGCRWLFGDQGKDHKMYVLPQLKNTVSTERGG
jgi:hypothetical protein